MNDLARADRQQDFLPQLLFELFEIQRGFTFVAQHFEHGRTILVRHFDAAVFQVHHMHLQRLDLEIPVIAAVRTSQSHRLDLQEIECIGWGGGRKGNYFLLSLSPHDTHECVRHSQ